MSNTDNKKATEAVPAQEGIDIKKVTFDENGEVAGLDDEVLKNVSGGLMQEGNNIACDEKC